MLNLFIVSIRGEHHKQEVLEAKLSYEEAFAVVKKYVHKNWSGPGEIPPVEEITEDQVGEFFNGEGIIEGQADNIITNRDLMGYGYEIRENAVDFHPNLLLVNDGIDYTLMLFGNEEDAGKAYRQEIFDR